MPDKHSNPSSEPLPRTVPEMLSRSARLVPDLPALRRSGTDADAVSERFTFAELERESEELALALIDLGVVPEERVGLIGENRPRWGAAYFAIHKAGAIAVPMDAALKERELEQIGRAAELRYVLATPRLEPVVRAALPKVRILSLGESEQAHLCYSTLLARGRAFRRRPQLHERSPSPERLAALIFTSGTTGKPKAVALSHRNVAANVNAVLQSFSVTPRDRFLSVLPLHHTFECTMGLLMPVAAGASVTYARSLKSRELMEDLREVRVTIMLGVPLLYQKMLEGIERALCQGGPVRRGLFLPAFRALRRGHAPMWAGGLLMAPLRAKAGLDQLRFFAAGAAPLGSELVYGFRALGIEILEGYGLTESAPVLSVNPPGANRPGSVGQPIPGVELRIDAPGPDGEGEVLARGENIMVGYYGDRALTASVMEGGWFHTGDLGRIDADGYLYLCGRKKNVIATGGGKKIYPEEVEQLLASSPLIVEAMVYGRRDPRTQHEDVCAVVLPDWEAVEAALGAFGRAEDESAARALLKAEIARLSGQIADYKRVRDFSIRREDFPRTTTGKVKRFLFENGNELAERPPGGQALGAGSVRREGGGG